MTLAWLHPRDCDPPHRVTHIEKLDGLIASIADGWNGPALLGYVLDGRVQLISGSHRHAVSSALGLTMPVALYSYNEVADIYGTDAWVALMSSAPMVSR